MLLRPVASVVLKRTYAQTELHFIIIHINASRDGFVNLKIPLNRKVAYDVTHFAPKKLADQKL